MQVVLIFSFLVYRSEKRGLGGEYNRATTQICAFCIHNTCGFSLFVSVVSVQEMLLLESKDNIHKNGNLTNQNVNEDFFFFTN